MPSRRRIVRRILPLTVFVAVGTVIFLNGCSTTIPNRNPTGEVFPAVTGQSLEETPVTMPDAWAGAPAVVLVGYRQRTQFDIDRWAIGLIQAGIGDTGATFVEVPTIPGLAASFASGWIDDGMRSGIPKEDWGSVVTLYGSAAKPVAELTGTERGRLSRVLVLDDAGTIVWFDDEGFSPRKAVAVVELLREMVADAGVSPAPARPSEP